MNQMKRLRFYKNKFNRWFIDLPMWTGNYSDLEMVEGADTLLDHLANENKKVVLKISDEKFENSSHLTLIGKSNNKSGADYKWIEMNLEIWLCDVTKFVLGYFPEKIYFLKVR